LRRDRWELICLVYNHRARPGNECERLNALLLVAFDSFKFGAMSCVGLARRCAMAVLFCLAVGGCFPVADNQLDERKEPHFITGKNLVGQMDYQGAVDAYEKALEVNPRSASAHFELGWLYEDKVSDPAAAIYHYERYLKFSANPDKADLVRQHITSCKSELARTASAFGPLPSPVQRELERVAQENKDLQARVTSLQSQLDQAHVTQSPRSMGTITPLPQNPIPNPNIVRPPVEPARNPSPHGATVLGNHPAAGATARTCVVRSGDTPAAIARRYGISVNALLAANPQVKPTHMQVGQALNIPAP
jgi:LysM repeat protein